MNRRWVALALALVAILLAAQASPGHAIVLALGLLLGHALGSWLRSEHFALRRAELTRRSVSMPDDALASVLSALEDAVILVNRRGTVTFANAAARAAFPAVAARSPLSFALRDPALLDALAAVTGKPVTRNVDLLERVPVERAFACTITGLAAATAGDIAAVLLLHETSREKAVETMRADFIANASHELRTPLASVLGFIETLQGPARNDAAARDKFLGIMAVQARRMGRLVDDLLSLSRMEMKKHIAPADRVDLLPVMRHLKDALSALAGERGVVIEIIARSEQTTVRGDRDELLSVFDNLIENAIKYGKSGGRVEIDLADAANPGELAVTVRDFGAGIAPEHLPRLTERFYRVDNAQSRAEGGTGLGLALVKHTVSRHRGRLAIESRPGEGAAFTVTLPRHTEPAQLS
jgi:two-component system phosphate regulon sensor histidine kinase PhoR